MEEAAASCSGWWLGQVAAVVTSDGNEEEPPHFDTLVSLEEKAGRARKRNETGGGGGAEGAGGPRVLKVKVMWYGRVEPSGKVSCKGDGPMNPLLIYDVVPRNNLNYEQWKPKDIELKASQRLSKPSLTKITGALPRPYVRPTAEQGHMEDVVSTQALQSTYNHAGVLIRPNEPPRPEEMNQWEATLQEIKGFEWHGPRKAEDPEPPTYRVADIRRQEGVMYAVVTTSYYQAQHDHLIVDVRRRLYRSRVVDKLSLMPPYMLSWAKLKDTRLTVDWKAIYDCALSYQDALR